MFHVGFVGWPNVNVGLDFPLRSGAKGDGTGLARIAKSTSLAAVKVSEK
jgi:hypothetical protein